MPILGALVGLLLLSGAVAVNGVPQAPAPAAPDATSAAHGAPAARLVSGATYSVAMTAYNAVPAQTDNNPLVTASGAYSNPQVVAARSQDLASELPFGTIIAIEGPAHGDGGTCGYSAVRPIIGYRVIADTMNRKFTDRIDLLFSTKDNYVLANGKEKNAALILGKCDDVVIRVVGHIDLSHPSNLPKTQEELASIVSGSQGLALR